MKEGKELEGVDQIEAHRSSSKSSPDLWGSFLLRAWIQLLVFLPVAVIECMDEQLLLWPIPTPYLPFKHCS